MGERELRRFSVSLLVYFFPAVLFDLFAGMGSVRDCKSY